MFLKSPSGKSELTALLMFCFVACAFACITNAQKTDVADANVAAELKKAKPPAIKSFEIGKSVKGIPIRLHLFGERGPIVLIFGGIHGDEPESQYVSLCLIDYLLANEDLYANRRIAVIPTANPDGIVQNTRFNAHHVDCNRNFPASNWEKKIRIDKFYGGPEPASEPETRAIISAVDALKPKLVIAVHVAIKDTVPFCIDPDSPDASKIAEVMSKHNGYPVIEDMGYATPGSFGTWSGKDRGITTVTLELRDFQPWPELWLTHRDALLAAIEYVKPPKDTTGAK